MATKKIIDGIRSYLDSLGQSDKPVVNREAVKALKAQVRDETDNINKLKLLAELEREEAGRVQDHSGERAVFVAEAKAWAEGEGIPVSAFQALGVPDEVLKEAGFELPAGGRGSGSSRAGRSAGTRAPRIPIEDVLAAAQALPAQWKLADLAEKLGRDATTTRNYVKKLVEQGSVVEVGDDPEHDGRGRAAKVYRMA
ncbi:MAG TPA: hypothetical protein VEW93_06965 [Acidimicrobiales bacterium]|nr:hypothetical protein [Acidimicrobiales bacterium]